jgi:hypothetical protein
VTRSSNPFTLDVSDYINLFCHCCIVFCSTFEPCWNIVKSSTEILANSYTQAVQQLHELIKVVRDYTEAQKEGQKSVS